MNRGAEQRVRELADQIADEFGLGIVDVVLTGSGRRMLVRVYIERKEGSVTLNDCELFSKHFESVLDVEDPIAGPYTLEVSSPGLDRPLKSHEDFCKNVGKLMRITTKEKIENQSFFIGRLRDVINGVLHLSLTEGKKEISIPFESIAKAKLEIEIS